MQSSQRYEPYGHYARGTYGHVKNELAEYGIPILVIDSLRMVTSGFDRPESERDVTLYDGREMFGRLRYFDGIEQPLFYFKNGAHMAQRTRIDEDGNKKLDLRLNLYTHGSAALVINDELATEHLHDFISQMMRCSQLGDKRYELKQKSGAFFQGGSGDPTGKFIYIEFWKPAGAQAFVDYINETYVFDQ